MPKRSAFDSPLFVVTIVLVLAGLVMVASSSNYAGVARHAPSFFYFRQAAFVALGLFGLFAAMTVRYQTLASRRLIAFGFFASIALLLATLAMPEAGGARRWIPVGPVRLQPSEFIKIYAVIAVASIVARRGDRIREPKAVLIPISIIVGSLAFLIAIEDLGSATVVVLVSGVMLFVAGLPWRMVGFAGAAAAGAFALGALVEPYRMRRLMTFVDPTADPLGAGYQLDQSLIAFGHGGALGVGLMQGQQKADFVFGSHTDFIFSSIGEELGLWGTLSFLALFLFVGWRGLRATRHAPDRFGRYLALGLTTLLVGQALVNMGVCVGLLPTKGLALPFVSYGGSSLLASLAAMGLLLNVSQHAH